MSLAVVGSLGPIILVFINLYAPQGYSTNTIILIATLPSFFTGVGNYLILPFALAYGRRPAFLLAAVALVASCIGAAASQNFVGHLVARVFQGLTSGATESVRISYMQVLMKHADCLSVAPPYDGRSHLRPLARPGLWGLLVHPEHHLKHFDAGKQLRGRSTLLALVLRHNDYRRRFRSYPGHLLCL